MLRLSRLTADLRKIADIEQHRVDRRPVDVSELLEEAMEIAREQPGAARAVAQPGPAARAVAAAAGARATGDLLSLAVLQPAWTTR